MVEGCKVFHFLTTQRIIHCLLKHSCNLMINLFSDNPTRFSVFTLGHMRKKLCSYLKIFFLDMEDYVKFLGVDIDNNLSFNSNMTRICAKAGIPIQVPRRLYNILTSETKLLLFKPYVLFQFIFYVRCAYLYVSRLRQLMLQIYESIQPFPTKLYKAHF